MLHLSPHCRPINHTTAFRFANFFVQIPGRVAPPGIVLFFITYLSSYWLGGRQVAALDKAKLAAVQNGEVKNGEANGHPVPAIRKHVGRATSERTTSLTRFSEA